MTASISSIKYAPRPNPDADVLAMIERHHELFALSEIGGELPAELLAELVDLEVKIVARPVFTPKGLPGWNRVVAIAEIDDDFGIVAELARLNCERVCG
jgi:hypothetical protein